MYFNFFMWSKMLMLKLPVEETVRANADLTVSVVTTCTAGRRRDTFGRNNGNQNHGEL